MEAQGIEIARAFVSVEPDLRKLEAGFAAGDAQAKAFARSVGASTGGMAKTATADAAKVSNAWTSAGKSMQAAGTTMVAGGKKVSSIGSTLNKTVTLPLVAIGAVATKLSLDFGRSMQEIGTQAGASRKEVEFFKREVERLGAKGRYSQGPKELSAALFDIRSTGIKGAAAMKALGAASDLATVGNADLESTTSGLVGVLKTGIKGAGNMQEAIGTLNATIGAGKMHMEDLNAAIGTGFLGSAKGLGISLGGVGAALAELTSQGVPANSAATRLRMTMSLLANPTEKAADVLKGIGIGSEDLAKKMRSSGSLIPALRELEEHMQGLSKVEQGQLLSSAFGGAKSGGTIIQLLGQLGDLESKQKQVFGNTKKIGGAIAEANEDPAIKFQKVWSALQFDLIKLGNVLIPALEPVIMEVGGAIAHVAEDFDHLSPSTKSWIVKIGLAAVALGPVLSLTGKIAGGIGGIIKIAGTAAEAIGGVGAAESGTGAAATAAAAETVAANTAAIESYAALGAAAEASAATQVTAGATGATGAAAGAAGQMSMLGPEAAPVAGQLSLLGSEPLATSSAGMAAAGPEVAAGAAAGTEGLAGMGAAAAIAAPEIAAVVAAIAAVTAGVILLYKHSASFRGEVAKMVDAAVKAFGEITDQVDPLVHSFDHIGHAFENLHGPIGAIVTYFKGVFVTSVEAAVAAATRVIQGLGKMFAGEVQIVRGVVELIADLLEGKFGKAWGAVKTIFSGGIKATLGLLEAVVGPIRGIAETIGHTLSKVFGGVWGTIEGIFTDGANAVVGVINEVIDVLDKIPGVDIGHVGTIGGAGGGGGHSKSNKGLHHQHRYTGGPITKPTAIVGEEAPHHPEWVIATNPVYRNRNLNYWAQAGKDLGVPGFATGGNMGGPSASGLSIPSPGDVAGAVGNAVGGAASSVAGAAGDIIGAGASHFIGMLPKPHLPEPFSGVGAFIIDQVTQWIKDGFKSEKIGDLNISPGALGGFTGPPANMKQLGSNTYVDSHTLAVTAALDNMFGLTMSSGYRTPQHNAEIGGVPGSLHTHGSPSNPGATDSVGPMAKMNAYVAYARQHVAGLQEALVDNAAGWNAHLGFFKGGGEIKSSGVLSPEEWGAAMIKGGFPKVPKVISEGIGTVKSESSFNASNMSQGAGGHIGGWAESPAFGSTATRLSPVGSSAAAKKEWEKDGHSFWQAWGQWESQQSGLSGGGAGTYGPEYLKTAEHVIASGVTGSGSKETVPGVFHGAHTHSLSFGAMPKTLHGVEKELSKRRGELKTYRRAADAAKGKPATQRAIQANVTKIEKRINELDHARAQLRRKAAQKKFSHRLGKKMAKLTGFETQIEAKERSYEIANEYASQLVDLEPVQPELPESATEAQREESEKAYVATLKSYIDTKERPAYGAVLEAEKEWRNTALAAESKATGMEGGWEDRIRNLESNIKSINDFTDKVAQDVGAYRHAHPKGDLPDWIQREEKKRNELRAKLPMMRFKEDELRTALGEGRDLFYPGVKNPVLPPVPPLAGTGTFEEALIGAQGIHWPDQHEPLGGLPSNPVAGKFGGAIWDTQTTIAELDLHVPSVGGGGGSSSSTENTALVEAAKKVLTESNQRALVEAVQKPVLDAFGKMPPFGGSFATGGEVPGPMGAARTVIAHGGETITPAGQSSSRPIVNVIIEDGAVDMSKVRVVANEEIDVRLSRGGRAAGRRLPGGPGGGFLPGN